MKHLKLILSILFIFCLTRTYADDSNYLFRHYQVENGLSDNMATCCVQDRKGYIWDYISMTMKRNRSGTFLSQQTKGSTSSSSTKTINYGY